MDDALAVFGVHGVGGTWGALATGLFVGVGFSSFGNLAGAASRGEQIINQLIGIGATCAWAFVATAIILYVLKVTMGLKVSEQEEEAGLDVSQHAEPGYRL